VTLDVMGPEVVTHADLAKIASEVSGKPVSYVKVTPDDLRKQLTAAGQPPSLVEFLVFFDGGIAQGEYEIAMNAVAELTGKAPQSVRDFLTERRALLLG
jgi:NAD(P)H dehydrogenase (quinone)